MKILMTSDCVGGVWTYAMELARELTATGQDIVLAVMGGELSAAQRREIDGAGLASWEARSFKLEWMPDPEDDLADAGAWLLQLARRHQPDLVHLNQFNFGSLSWPAPAVVVAHSDVVSWWRAVHGTDPPPAWAAYRDRVNAGLAGAAAVVAPTAAVASDLRSAFDVGAQTTVIHNGRKLAPHAMPKRQLIAAAGRMDDPGKNVETAVRATDGLPWDVAVAGPGPEHRAQFRGRLSSDEFTALLAEAAVFVEPARYEPFGLAALEAALSGCALVLGDIASLREVWGPAATFVDPDDASAVRDALQQLVDDADLLRRRQRDAVTRASALDLETMATAYADIYRAVLDPTRRDRVAP